MSTPQLTDPRWTLTLAITALENWGRHFEWCSSLKPPYYPEWPYTNDPLPLSCDCGLSTQTAELRLMRDTIPSPAPLLPVPEEEIERLARIASDAFGFGEVMRWSNWHAVVRAVLAGAAQHEEGPLPAAPLEGKHND